MVCMAAKRTAENATINRVRSSRGGSALADRRVEQPEKVYANLVSNACTDLIDMVIGVLITLWCWALCFAGAIDGASDDVLPCLCFHHPAD